jgi:hypothetical protein
MCSNCKLSSGSNLIFHQPVLQPLEGRNVQDEIAEITEQAYSRVFSNYMTPGLTFLAELSNNMKQGCIKV